MNIRRALLVALAAGSAVAARAQALPGRVTVTPAVVSQYMFRGLRLGGPSLQPGVEYDAGGAALGLWCNFPLSAKVPGQSDPEVDLYGSWKVPVHNGVDLQPGFTWYTYANANPQHGFYRSTFEPSVAANWTVDGITLTPRVYYDVVLDGPTYELSAAYALPLRAVGTELDFNATAGTYRWQAAVADRAPAVRAGGDYWLAGITLPYRLPWHATISFGLAYTEGVRSYRQAGAGPRSSNPQSAGRGVVTLSYAMTF